MEYKAHILVVDDDARLRALLKEYLCEQGMFVAAAESAAEARKALADIAFDLMGYTSSDDTKLQVRLSFDTEEEAVAYARKHGLSYEVQEPHARQLRIKAYADNFKYSRVTRA